MEQAAIFDFDARLFGKQAWWRVQNPRVGYSGALKDPTWVFQFWKKHSRDEGFMITDSLELVDPGFSEATSTDGLAFLPVQHIALTALQHRIRGRSLFLLGTAGNAGFDLVLRDIVRQTFELAPGPRSNLPSQRGNPLETADFLECREVDFSGIDSADDLPLAKFRRLRSLVSMTDGPEGEDPGPYERVFLYTSDPVLAMLVERHTLENQERFEGGRNALMLSMIVNINTETLSAAQTGTDQQ